MEEGSLYNLEMTAEEEEIERSCVTERHHLFKDGEHTIDFVLVWDEIYEESTTSSSREKRKIYEENLIEEGLKLEYESNAEGVLHFVKVHAPLEVLRRYSEILKLRLPMKEELCEMRRCSRKNVFHGASTYIYKKVPVLKKNNILGKIKHFWHNCWADNIYVDHKIFPEQGRKFTAVYSRDKEYLSAIKIIVFNALRMLLKKNNSHLKTGLIYVRQVFLHRLCVHVLFSSYWIELVLWLIVNQIFMVLVLNVLLILKYIQPLIHYMMGTYGYQAV